MTKKRAQNFKQLQGPSPISQSSSPKRHGESLSVNARLSELRRLEGRDAWLKKQEFAEASSSQQSIPPTLRTILGLPETRPPKPKYVGRYRAGGRGSRVPGPEAPASWSRRPARGGMLALRSKRPSSSTLMRERSRPATLLRFARMTRWETFNEGGVPALLHLTLKATAEHWEWFDAADLPALAELPLRLRLRLLTYLGFYGPTIDRATFDSLTQGTEPLLYLDLGGLAGHGSLPFSRLLKSFKQRPANDNSDVPDEVAESWEHELPAIETLSLSSSRFASLTHLCLSHPPPEAVSWRDLLSLCKYVPKVTHLSLAYWSRPTLTPNLATARVTTTHGLSVAAGGSHYYSGIDRDYTEPASLLRQLSSLLLRLKWLDLEGCTSWMPALAVEGDSSSSGGPDFEQQVNKSTVESIFIGSWKNLEYLHCPQAWLPSAYGMDSLPKQTIPRAQKQIVDDFLKPMQCEYSTPDSIDIREAEKRKAEIWVQEEEMCVAAGARINTCRRLHACRPITIDHGWTKRVL